MTENDIQSLIIEIDHIAKAYYTSTRADDREKFKEDFHRITGVNGITYSNHDSAVLAYARAKKHVERQAVVQERWSFMNRMEALAEGHHDQPNILGYDLAVKSYKWLWEVSHDKALKQQAADRIHNHFLKHREHNLLIAHKFHHYDYDLLWARGRSSESVKPEIIKTRSELKAQIDMMKKAGFEFDPHPLHEEVDDDIGDFDYQDPFRPLESLKGGMRTALGMLRGVFSKNTRT